MRFSIFGIPTFVNWGFWLAGVFLGMGYLSSPYKVLMLAWLGVIFVSILVHELGHAVACIRYGLSPAIELHMMGGVCSYEGGNKLTRKQQMVISFAGPLAGFVFAGLIWGILQAFPVLMRPSIPGDLQASDVVRIHTFRMLLGVNTIWGLVNLLPVLPLDGGHILSHALGPKRSKTAAQISLATGAGVTLLCLVNAPWIESSLGLDATYLGLLFSFLAFNNYMRYRQENELRGGIPSKAFSSTPALSPEVHASLLQLRKAYDSENYDRAEALAEDIAQSDAPASARLDALEISAWSQLLQEPRTNDRVARARSLLKRIEKLGNADTALLGAIFFASDELRAARNVFEAARAAGDDRKEIVGPLIQILINEGEVARAAAIALDIVDTLSEDDVHQMAELASQHGCHAWASRLSEAIFERSRDPEDAFNAGRARALAGDNEVAATLFEQARTAGLSDLDARLRDDSALPHFGTDEAVAAAADEGTQDMLQPSGDEANEPTNPPASGPDFGDFGDFGQQDKP